MCKLSSLQIQKSRGFHIVCDNLNIHQSEALVRWVAQISDVQQDLGKKGEYGILALMPRRAKFLSDPTHKVVFHYTPNHSSWLNQIEIWLSILVRKVLKRGSFSSIEELETKVVAFIDYYNHTAKPFQWTRSRQTLNHLTTELFKRLCPSRAEACVRVNTSPHCRCYLPDTIDSNEGAYFSSLLSVGSVAFMEPMSDRKRDQT
jgi:transposase